MKGAKGECIFFDEDKNYMCKTKFDKEENCQARIETLLRLEVTKPNTTTYKCKVCNMWHLGTPYQKEKYGKKV